MLKYDNYKYFFGKVTMYTSYNIKARNTLLNFLHKYFPDPEKLVLAKEEIDIDSSNRYYEELFKDLDYKEAYKVLQREVKLNGESVVNENGSIDLQLGSLDTTLGETITCNQAIGGISAGTTFTEDTTIADIIRALLKIPVVETDGAIYYGLSRDIPTSIDGLTPVSVDRDTLLSSGYTYKNINTDDQRVILAIPKSFGIVCYQISVSGFGIGFDFVETDKYIIYYDGLSTGSYRYVYSFEEA